MIFSDDGFSFEFMSLIFSRRVDSSSSHVSDFSALLSWEGFSNALLPTEFESDITLFKAIISGQNDSNNGTLEANIFNDRD